MIQRSDSLSRGSSNGSRKSPQESTTGSPTTCPSSRKPPLEPLNVLASSGFMVVHPELQRANRSPRSQKRWATRLKTFICLILAAIVVIVLVTWEIQHLRSEMRRIKAVDALAALHREGGLHGAQAPGELAFEEAFQKRLNRSKQKTARGGASGTLLQPSSSVGELKQLAAKNLAGFGAETRAKQRVGAFSGAAETGEREEEEEEEEEGAAGASPTSYFSSSALLATRLHQAKAAFKDLELQTTLTAARGGLGGRGSGSGGSGRGRGQEEGSTAATHLRGATKHRPGTNDDHGRSSVAKGAAAKVSKKRRSAISSAIEGKKREKEDAASKKWLEAKEAKQRLQDQAMAAATAAAEAYHAKKEKEGQLNLRQPGHHAIRPKSNLKPNRLNLGNKSKLDGGVVGSGGR